MPPIAAFPPGYLAVTPWIVARNVPSLMDFLKNVFDAGEIVRMYANDGVRVNHAEVRIDGAPVMMFDSTDDWPLTPAFLRVYVSDCDAVMRRAAASTRAWINRKGDSKTPLTHVSACVRACVLQSAPWTIVPALGYIRVAVL